GSLLRVQAHIRKKMV
nr:Chain B, Myosin-A [Plasmodium falciparum 3D7]